MTFFLLVGTAVAQYNYQKPEPPKNTYLPPKPESEANVAAEGLAPEVRNL